MIKMKKVVNDSMQFVDFLSLVSKIKTYESQMIYSGIYPKFKSQFNYKIKKSNHS